MLKLKLITFISCISFCYAIPQQIAIYSKENCTGDAIVFESKQPDLTNYRFILDKSQSMSVVGVWGLYRTTKYGQFVRHWQYSGEGPEDTKHCFNYTTDALASQSMRYHGPPDTTTPSISFYDVTFCRGNEVTVTGPEYANLPFSPSSIFTTGFTNWTLYSGSNFDGERSCLTPQRNKWYELHIYWRQHPVRSVQRGCNGRAEVINGK